MVCFFAHPTPHSQLLGKIPNQKQRAEVQLEVLEQIPQTRLPAREVPGRQPRPAVLRGEGRLWAAPREGGGILSPGAE